TGGPVALALSGGSPAQVTALFAGLALFRAPYTLAIGLVSPLTGKLTSLVVRERHAALRRVRLATLAVTGVAVVLGGLVGATVGPYLLRLVFGEEVRLDRFFSLLVAVGSTLALANLVVTVTIMAQSRSGVVARAWVIGSLGGTLVFALASHDPLERTCWAFVAAEAVAFGVLAVEDIRGAVKPASPGAGEPGAPPLSESARRPRSSSA
ncbi:MAG: hypothetical protein ABJA81_13090, partial [Nocardioidaceae bacterium]